MSKQLLIETRMNPLSLCEGVQSKHPGCLGTLKGPCADYANATRNDNFYSRKLWVNVFNDPLVKESLEDRVLLGELDHPGDRLETKAANACIVMTGYEFDDDNQVVIGVFDILDTPNGKILRSLLDYGCKIGVSSRGEGDVTEENGVNNVDEEGYYFVAFDAVVLPAVKKAKPALQESVKRESLKESLKTQIESASTLSELSLIKRVLEATELPEVGSLMESIDNRSKELEGVNDSSNLMEDLENATSQINTLTEENKRLKGEVANSKSREKRFVSSRVKMIDDEIKRQKKYEALERQYNDAMFRLSATSKKAESLESKLGEARDRIQELTESLRTTRSTCSEYQEKISSLEESLKRSQNSGRHKSEEISKLTRQLESVKKDAAQQIAESKGRETEARNAVKKAQDSLKESAKRSASVLRVYAESRAKDQGVDPKRVVESMKAGMTTSDIDKIIEEEVDRSDRYRKMPTTHDRALSSLSRGTATISTERTNEQDSQTAMFMEQYYHQFK